MIMRMLRGTALLAILAAPLAMADDDFNFELSLGWDATRSSTTSTPLSIGNPPIPLPEITLDTDTDVISLFGTWYFSGASADEGPLSRAPFVSRASSLSFGYARNESSTDFNFSPEPIPITPSPSLPLPPPGITPIEPPFVLAFPVEEPGLDGDIFSLGGRYVWQDSGWFVFGEATFGEADLGTGASLDVDTRRFIAGGGLYIGRMTSIDVALIRNEREISSSIFPFEESETDVGISLSHIGAMGSRWQYGIDVGLTSEERVDGDDGTALCRRLRLPQL